MKKQIAHLTPEQIEQAWQFADKIEGEDEDVVRKDCLGAKICKKEYGTNAEYGWYVEYVLDQEFIDKYSTTHADIFCEANIRVLFKDNYLANKNRPVGNFDVYYRYEDSYNKLQPIRQPSDISIECIEALKETYGLSDTVIQQRIKID